MFAERVVGLKPGKLSGTRGDCSGIHVRNIVRYTRAYMVEVYRWLWNITYIGK